MQGCLLLQASFHHQRALLAFQALLDVEQAGIGPFLPRSTQARAKWQKSTKQATLGCFTQTSISAAQVRGNKNNNITKSCRKQFIKVDHGVPEQLLVSLQ